MATKIIPNSIKRPLLKVYFGYKHGFNRVKRSTNPYATHIPLFIGLGRILNARSVLELGSGLYSTGLFLNQDIFPQLTSVRSIENDSVWAAEMIKAFHGVPRVELVQIGGQVSDYVHSQTRLDYDLIFIDDSTEAIDRAATIRAVVEKAPHNAVIVIHDYENKVYQKAAGIMPYQYRFKAFNPNTGFLWNQKNLLNFANLKQIDRLTRKYAKLIAPDSLAEWSKIMATLSRNTP